MSRENEAEHRSLRQRLGRFFKWLLFFGVLATVAFLFVRSRLNSEPTITIEGGEATSSAVLPTMAPPGQPSTPATASGVCPDARRQIPLARASDPAAPQYLRDWASSTGCYPLDSQGVAVLLPDPLYGGSWIKVDSSGPYDQQVGTWAAPVGTLLLIENVATQERCYARAVAVGPEASGSHGAFHFFSNEALGRCLVQQQDLPPDFRMEVFVRVVNITPGP